MIFGSILATLCFFSFLVFKIGILHLYRIKNKSALILRVFLASIAGFILLGSILGGSILEILIGLVIMISFFILYMPFYYTISSSVSIQSLILLSEKDLGTSPLDVLKETFASAKVVSYKLNSMENSGMLLRKDKNYKITAKGKLIAGVFGSVKKIWNLGPGG